MFRIQVRHPSARSGSQRGADRCRGRRPRGGCGILVGAARGGAAGAGRLAAQRAYPFSSGCDYAQWAIIGTFLGDKGDPWGVADLLVPLAEVEIVDDWQVLGLLGTGTKSLVLEDGFAPEHRSVM